MEVEPVVLTPNRAVARRLGVPYRTLSGLARELLRGTGLEVASPYRARRLLVQAVGEALAPRDPKGLAATLEGPVRALLRAGAELGRLEKEASPRVARVAKAARRYRELLRARNLLDPAELLVEAGRLGKRLCLDVRGYPYLGQGELAFLLGVAAPGSRVELLQTEGLWGEVNRKAKEALKGARLKVKPLNLSPLGHAFLQGSKEFGGCQVQALRFPDMEAEVRHVLARIKELLSRGVPPKAIALVARDDRRYGPLVAAVGFEQGLPVRLLYRIPVGETRLGGLLALLGEALQGFPYEATLRLLSHPFSPWKNGVDLDRARRLRPSGKDWRDLGLPEELWALDQATSGQELAEGFRQVLKILEGRVRGWPRERAALEALRDGLRELEEEDKEGFFQGLSELLFHLTVPAQPGYGGVELHTPLARYGGRFRYLFVLGMAEGLTPAPVAEDPLLGFAEVQELKERFGVPLEEAWEAAAREALVFAALLGSVAKEGEVVLTYPQVVGRDPAPPSPFLRRLGLEPVPPQEILVASPVEARRLGLWEGDVLEAAMQAALEAERNRLKGDGSSPHHGATRNSYRPESLSVSALQDLATCPFRFFVQHVLRLAGDREAGDGDRQDEGAFLHAVLAHGVREAVALGKKRGQEVHSHLWEHLEAVFDRVERALANGENSPYFLRRPEWPHRRNRLLWTLKRVLEEREGVSEKQRERRRLFSKDAEVLAVEERVEGELQLGGFGRVKVVGRVDRIDQKGSKRTLWDYKHAYQVPKAKDPETGTLSLDFQLPLYRQLLEAAREGQGEGVEPEMFYYLLPKAERVEGCVSAGFERALEEVGRRLAEGSFPPKPDGEGKACRGCLARSLCRVGR